MNPGPQLSGILQIPFPSRISSGPPRFTATFWN